MDAETLRAFVATARRGSFSLAAAELGVSQPAVSRRVRSLERELGVALLERTRPAVTPTRAGLALLAFGATTLDAWDHLCADLIASREAGVRLHVAASTAPGEFLLPKLLDRFRLRRPDIEVELNVMNSETVEECVRARHCDIGVIGRGPRTPTLRSHVLVEEEVLLAVPAGDPLARAPEVRLEDLEGRPFILREAGSATWEAVDAALVARQWRLPAHRAVLRLTSAAAVLAAVTAGRGISFLGELALRRAELGRVVALRLDGLPIRRPISVIHEARRLSRSAVAFVEFVRAEARG